MPEEGYTDRLQDTVKQRPWLIGVILVGAVAVYYFVFRGSGGGSSQAVTPTESAEDSFISGGGDIALANLQAQLEQAQQALETAQSRADDERKAQEERYSQLDERSRSERDQFAARLGEQTTKYDDQIASLRELIADLRSQIANRPPPPVQHIPTFPQPPQPPGTPQIPSRPPVPVPPPSPRRDTTPPPVPLPPTSPIPGNVPADCTGVLRTPLNHPGSDPVVFVRSYVLGQHRGRRLMLAWAITGIGMGPEGLDAFSKWVADSNNWPAINKSRRNRGLKAMSATAFQAAAQMLLQMNHQNGAKEDRFTDEQLRQVWNAFHNPYLCY